MSLPISTYKLPRAYISLSSSSFFQALSHSQFVSPACVLTLCFKQFLFLPNITLPDVMARQEKSFFLVFVSLSKTGKCLLRQNLSLIEHLLQFELVFPEQKHQNFTRRHYIMPALGTAVLHISPDRLNVSLSLCLEHQLFYERKLLVQSGVNHLLQTHVVFYLIFCFHTFLLYSTNFALKPDSQLMPGNQTYDCPDTLFLTLKYTCVLQICM